MNKIHNIRKIALTACGVLTALTLSAVNFSNGNCTQTVYHDNNTGNTASAASITALSISDGAGGYNGVQLIINPAGTATTASWRNAETMSNCTFGGNPINNPTATFNATNTVCTLTFDQSFNNGDVIQWPVNAWRTDGTDRWAFDASTFTFGNCVDNANPSMTGATAGTAGKSKFNLTLSATDDICVGKYRITATVNGTPVDMEVPAPSCGASSTVTVSLPDGVQMTGATTYTVRAIDVTGKQSTNSRNVTVTPNTTAPTGVTASCYSSTATSLTLNVNATAGSGGAVTAYKVTYGPGNAYSQIVTPNAGRITVTGLRSSTNYAGMRVYAMDDWGNTSTSYATTNCSSTAATGTSNVCGVVSANNNQIETNNWWAFNSRVIVSVGKTADDEATVLIVPYPGTWDIAGIYLNTEENNNPDTNGYLVVQGEGGSLAAGTVVAPSGTKVSFQDVNIDGYGTVQGVRISMKYLPEVGFHQFYLRWSKYDHNGNIQYFANGDQFADANVNGGFYAITTDNFFCDNVALDNPSLDADWVTVEDRFQPSTPNNLDDDAIDHSDLVSGENTECTKLVFATNFSNDEAGKTHLSIEEVSFFDDTKTNYGIGVESSLVDGYVNGGFMATEGTYAIVENPHVLDESLIAKNDGVNRIVFNLPTLTGGGYYLINTQLENLTPESKVTVSFDYEYVADCFDLGRWRAFGVTIGTGYANITDQVRGHVEVTGTALSTTLFTIHQWGSGDCDAIAISNLKIYGCVDHTLYVPEGSVVCEGQEIHAQAVGYGNATTGFTWQEQIGGVWQTIAGQTTNTLPIIPELGVRRFRASRGGYTTDVLEVQGVVCCDIEENKHVIWSEDFGTVPAWTRYQYPRQDNTENWVVGHAFRDFGTRPGCTTDIWIEDPVGSGNWVCPPENRVPISYFGYTDTPRDGSNPWYYGEGFSKVDDGDYVIVSNSTYAEDGCDWVKDRTDHTGNPNGGFLLINVAATQYDAYGNLIPTQIIEKEIDHVQFCSGVWYNFSMWASQLAKRNQLPSSFYLEAIGVDESGNETLLGSITTGVMKNFQMDDWSHYGITFDPGDSKKIILKVFNMGQAGSGNDIVIDDLSLTVCYPDVELFADYSNLRHDADVLCGGTVHMGVTFDGEAARYFSSPAPYYLWQKCEWDAANSTRTPWVSIPDGAAAEGSGYHLDGEYGEGHTGHNFLDQDVAGTVDTTYYRVIMAGTKAIAEQIAADLAAGHDYTGCDVYNVSEIAKVSCFPCLKPEVAFTFTQRTLCESEAIGNFTQAATVTFEKAEDFMNYYEWQKYVPDAAHANTLDNPLEDYWTVLSSGGDKNGTEPIPGAVANLPYPTQTTLYRFLARNGRLGCDSTYVFRINIKPNPVTPVLSTDPGCDHPVTFTIDNFGADTTYAWTVNSAAITPSPGETYTVPSPVEGTAYLASVVATYDGCSSPAGTASQTYIITPDQPVVGTDPGCDKPVVFTVTNAAPAGYTNTCNWTVNGNSGTGDVYSVALPDEGTEYNASVTATRNGCTSTAGTASQTYVKTPATPTLSNNEGCGNDVRFTVTNYDATNTYAWKLDGADVTATNTYTVDSPLSGTTYSVSVVATKNNCSSPAGTQSQKRLVQPTIAIKNAAACSDDRLTYSATVTVSEGTVTTSVGTIAKQGATNDWLLTVTITDGNDNAVLTVVNADDLCPNTLTITEPDCSCPDMAAPSVEDKAFCDQIEAIPSLTATATLEANEEIQWFDVAAGGTPIFVGATYTPTTDGTYYVQVTNTLKDCTSPRVPVTVTRKPLPAQPTLTDNTGCDNQVIFTIGNYDAAYTYDWTVDGTGASSGNTYTVTAAAEGTTYNASVTATLNGCTSSAGTGAQKYTVTPAQPTLTDNAGCDNAVIFTIGNYDNANTYVWTVDGAGTESGATYQVTTPMNGTTYNASVTATRNNCTSAAGTGSQQRIETPATPTLTVDEDCDNPVVFTLSVYDADATYTWSLNQGSGTQTTTTYTVATPTEGETYTASVEVSRFGCATTSNSVSQQYKVTPSNLAVTLYPNVTQIDCTNPNIEMTASGNSVDSYSWTLSGAEVSTTASYTASVDGNYRVTATGKGGCTASFEQPLTKDSNIPDAPTLSNNDGCDNDVIFTVTNHNASYTYTWTLDGADISALVTGNSYQVPTPAEGQTYNISVSLLDPANGCTAGPGTALQQYKRYPATPVLTNNEGCDQDVIFTNTTYQTGTDYYWTVTPGAGSYLAGVYTEADPVEGTTYTAEVRAVRNGCERTATPVTQKYIVTPEQPTLIDNTGCNNEVIFTITNYDAANTYTWTVDGAGIESGATYQVTTPMNGATYNASVTAARNNCTSTAGTGSQQRIETPDTPTLTVDEGCDNPVVFTLSVYDANATYTWSLNQGTGTQTTTTYTVATPTEGETYTASVEVSRFGCATTSNTVSQQYKVTPTGLSVTLNPNVTQIDCANPNIEMTASGTSVDSYSWTLSGAEVSTTATYTASLDGNYRVTATGKGGCTAFVEQPLTKDSNIPDAPALTNNEGCDNDVIFTVTNYNAAYNYTWTLDGNDISASVTGNTYTVPAPTEGQTYNISVSLRDPANSCTAGPSTDSQFYKVTPEKPTLSDNTGCDQEVIFTITNPNADNAYTWAVSGTGSEGTNNYTVTGADEGTTYTATVTADRNGCTITSDVASQFYKVTPEQPVLSDNTGCDNEVIFTIDNYDGANTYTWTVDGAGTESGATYQITTPMNGSTYNASVTATRNNCTSAAGTDSQQRIETPSTPTLTVDEGCDNPVVFTLSVYDADATYTWSLNQGTGTQTTTTYTVATPTEGETYTASVEVSRFGCATTSNTVSQQYKVTPSNLAVTLNPNVTQIDCANPSIGMTASGNSVDSYSWTLSGAEVSTTATYTASEGGNYRVTATGKGGCTAFVEQPLTKDSNIPDAPALTNNEGCDNDVIFTVTNYNAAYNYTWTLDGNDISASVTGNTYTVPTPTEGQTYNLSVSLLNPANSCPAGPSSDSQFYKVTPEKPTLTDNTGCDKDVIFTITNPNVANDYTWTVSGTGTKGTDNYTVAGVVEGTTYTATVTADRNGCTITSDMASQFYKITPEKPTLSDNTGCDKDVIFTITNPNAANAYTWTVSGAGTEGTNNYRVTGAAEGTTYTATVTADRNGCTITSDEASQFYQVTPATPTLTDNTGCDNEVVFTLSVYDADATYDWTLNQGSGVQNATTYTINSPIKGNTYTASVKVSKNNCQTTSNTASQQYKVTPTVTIVPTVDVLTCVNVLSTLNTTGNDIDQYAWTTSEGNNGSSASSIVISTPGNYLVTVTGKGGCTASDQLTMTEHKPDPHIQLATLPAVCYPATLDLADAVLSHEGTVYFYRDAAYSQRMQTTMVAQPGTETYYILVDNEGCILKTSMQATINEIDIELSGDLHLCAEEDYAVSMRMVGPQASQYSYQWTSSLGAVQDKLVFPQSTITDVASENITYSLHVANGACQVDETVLVEVNPLPVYTVDTSDKDSVFVQLQSSGYEPYEFNFEPTGSQAWGSFVRPEPGNYLVSVIDNYGCKTEQYVDIERILVPLVIPPFFTPNGDGVNDIWHIENIEYYPEAVIRIYDRFSKLVAEYNGTVPGWDGTYRGHPMVSTDYWYYIKIEVLGKPISGHVTLFRGKGAD